MAAASFLTSAREASGVTQSQLARRIATAQSAVSVVESGDRNPTTATLERMLAAARHRLIAVPSVRSDGASTAERIRTAVSENRPAAAMRAYIDFADALALEEPAIRVALAVARPRLTGSPAWDAALAAVVHHRLGRASLPLPSWLDEPERTLPEPTQPDLGVATLAVDPARVAPEFSRRNVLVDEGMLASI